MDEDAVDDLGTAADGEIFALDRLAAVVRVKCPAVLPRELLRGVLAHDLRSGNRLALADGVAVADVEDEAGWAAHRLDTNEAVGDEAGVALADHGQGKAGEVRDVACGRCFLEDWGACLRVPGFELVFEDSCHQAILVWPDFEALAEDRCPAVDELVLAAFEQQAIFTVLPRIFRDHSTTRGVVLGGCSGAFEHHVSSSFKRVPGFWFTP